MRERDGIKRDSEEVGIEMDNWRGFQIVFMKMSERAMASMKMLTHGLCQLGHWLAIAATSLRLSIIKLLMITSWKQAIHTRK